MTVIFQTKSKTQNRYSISNIPGFGKVFFPKGVKTTSDKDLVKALLNHPLYDRGDYFLVSNEEMVVNYLEGGEPDVLTEDLLNGLSRQGIKELGTLLSARSEQPSLIKYEIVNKPITTEVQQILDFYTLSEDDSSPIADTASEEVEAEAQSEEVIEDRPLSTDMSAADAIEYIENRELGELEGFVPEYEDRKTVQKAIQNKTE